MAFWQVNCLCDAKTFLTNFYTSQVYNKLIPDHVSPCLRPLWLRYVDPCDVLCVHLMHTANPKAHIPLCVILPKTSK